MHRLTTSAVVALATLAAIQSAQAREQVSPMSTTAAPGLYYDQGSYVPAFPGGTAMNRQREATQEERRYFVTPQPDRRHTPLFSSEAGPDRYYDTGSWVLKDIR